MNFKVYTTSYFKRESKRLSKRHRSLKNDLLELIESLESNPTQGAPLGKNCYKIRLSILTIFDKTDRENISNKDLEALIKSLSE